MKCLIIIVCILLWESVSSAHDLESFACVGDSCGLHNLHCYGTKISIISAYYGYTKIANDCPLKKQCRSGTCCVKKWFDLNDDCLPEFTKADYLDLRKICDGQQHCDFTPPQRLDYAGCLRKKHFKWWGSYYRHVYFEHFTYSFIEYKCLKAWVPYTARPTTKSVYKPKMELTTKAPLFRTTTGRQEIFDPDGLLEKSNPFPKSGVEVKQPVTSQDRVTEADKPDTVLIAGSVVGVLIFIILVVFVVIFIVKRKTKTVDRPENTSQQHSNPTYGHPYIHGAGYGVYNNAVIMPGASANGATPMTGCKPPDYNQINDLKFSNCEAASQNNENHYEEVKGDNGNNLLYQPQNEDVAGESQLTGNVNEGNTIDELHI
ncbi:uncharacterized protein LOC126810443 [Patella vulgata]|uniref:uncharacterized protein LOC126810443 n=1 Tax=Patella vulgata TaxID=6465 RepID=UPI00217F5B5D|nr:uncharacterized protein LOC126810443 [Patella vulgata]